MYAIRADWGAPGWAVGGLTEFVPPWRVQDVLAYQTMHAVVVNVDA